MRPYRHTCFLLCRCTAVVAAVALLCIGFSSCSGGKKYGDERTPEHQAALKRLDDSMFVKSDNVLDTMLLGLKKSSDSLTLSKILCKCKQDSVISYFLYLDSVFKHKHKLIHNQSPVMNRLCPFLLNLYN